MKPYDSFAEIKSSNPNISCKVGEPSSYKDIIFVIQSIGQRAGVKQYGGEEREWLFVECDGLPYNTLRHLIDKVWRCEKCNECYYGLEAFEDHKCFILHNVQPKREFTWLIPISGLLHLEMNTARAFVKFNWPVFTSLLGQELGFKSPKAQEYLKKGSDHHKNWHFLEILYISISLELVTTYVKHCIASNGERPSVIGYWKWSQLVEDPNYIYMQHMFLTYLHALMILRVGVRKCNAEVVQDAKSKLSHLIFGSNHPIYRHILFRDAMDDILMPPDLKCLKYKYISASRTGNAEKMQGDVMLEEINKESKQWLKMAGIPSEQQWLRVFRNLDKLNKASFPFYPTTHIQIKFFLNSFL